MTEPTQPVKKRPTGVYLLALLLFAVGGIFLLAAVALPFLGLADVPWYIYLGGAAYFIIMGWGLWGFRRWAYFAALLMCIVLGFYTLQTAVVFQRNTLLPFILLLGIFAYLFQPQVRAEFLRGGEAEG